MTGQDRKRRIAILEDERDILELVALHMERAGFETMKHRTAGDLMSALQRLRPDLLILDLMLPDASGIEVCRTLRANRDWAGLPIVMLTALGEEADRVTGLEIGADDYVTKPFSPRELVARVRAVLRRSLERRESSGRATVGGILTVDPERFEATVSGRPVALTSTEFRILAILASQPGRVFTREQILDRLWGSEKAVLDRTVDVHVRHIREKLGDAASLLRNVRGVGYKLET